MAPTSTWCRPARAAPRAAISWRTTSTSSTHPPTWRAMPVPRRRTAVRATAGVSSDLVSTGKGRTTCGYFLADNKHIVYASTHLAGDACPTPPDRSKGYVWGVFAGYDIFEATDTGKIVKRRTDTPGYDAEATINWKTGNMVYTSLASGDLDLWTMKVDGSVSTQITRTPGYRSEE